VRIYALGTFKHPKLVNLRVSGTKLLYVTAAILHHLPCEFVISWAECESFSSFTDALLGSHMGFCHICDSLLSMGIFRVTNHYTRV